MVPKMSEKTGLLESDHQWPKHRDALDLETNCYRATQSPALTEINSRSCSNHTNDGLKIKKSTSKLRIGENVAFTKMGEEDGSIHCSYSVSLVLPRSFDRRSSFLMASLNLQAMILGTTTLCVPFGFQQAGIYAVPLFVVIGLVTCYTGETLGDCLYIPSTRMRKKRMREYSSYLELCHASWPSIGGFIMKIIIFSTLARNVAIFILLSNVTQNLAKRFLPHDFTVDARWWGVLWLCLILPLLFIKRVSAIAWVSLMGLVPYLIALFATLFYCLSLYKSWTIENIDLDFDMEGLAIAFGIFMNSNAVHLSFPILEGSMRSPKHYKNVVRLAFIFNTILKVLFGIFALLSFGDETKESITGNIKHYTVLVVIVRVGVLCFSYLTIPMQSYVVFDHVDDLFYKRVRRTPVLDVLWRLTSRLLLMTLCLLIAVLFPHFGLVLSIIGSLRGVLVTLILPCLIHLILHKHASLPRKAWNIIIIIFGTVGSALGLGYSLKSLVEYYD